MAVTTPAGWYPDPMRRHGERYWDGGRWTEHVADAGRQSVDAVESPVSLEVSPALSQVPSGPPKPSSMQLRPPPPAPKGQQRGPIGRPRSVRGIILLSLLTCGIYQIAWYFITFHEIKRHSGRGVGFPLVLIVVIIPGLCQALMGNEIKAMYESMGLRSPCSGWTALWLLLPFLGVLVWLFRIQGSLTAYWMRASVAL